MRAWSAEALQAGDRVALSVRPEDVQLSEQQPSGPNTWKGIVDQKVFLGETVDFQVKIGPRLVRSRVHPWLHTPVGAPIWSHVNPEKCVAMKASDMRPEAG